MLFILLILSLPLQRPTTQLYQRWNNADTIYYDSLNVELVGNWPFGPVRAVYCDTVRDLAFLASFRGVYILDISNPQNPVKLSEAIHANSPISDLFFDHITNSLYITSYFYGLEIWDINNPSSPFKTGEFYSSTGDTCDQTLNIYKEGNYAYLLKQNSGLRIIDVSSPSTPVEVGLLDSIDYISDIFVKDSFAYLTVGDLYIVNISNPTNPIITSICTLSTSVTSVFVKDSFAYVSSRNYLYSVNISSPLNPIVVDSCAGGSPLYITNNYACLTTGHSNLDLRIVDISDPLNIYEIGYLDLYTGTYFEDIFAYNTNVFIPIDYDHSSALHIFDISSPSNPQFCSKYKTPIQSLGLFVKDNYSYVTDIGYDTLSDSVCTIVRVIDINNLNNPYEIGSCEVKGFAENIFVLDSYAYIASFEDSLNSSLRIVDISDPTNPEEISFIYSPNHLYYYYDVYCKDNYAYIVHDGANYFEVIDISDPYNPVHKLTKDITCCASAIDIRGDYAYFYGWLGLSIIDISNPLYPIEISFLNLDGGYNIHISGNYAYTIVSLNNHAILYIVDISDPYNPQEVNHYVMDAGENSPKWDIYVKDNLAYISGQSPDIWSPVHFKGLRILDISDPLNIFEVGNYYTRYPTNITLSNNYIFINELVGGLQIYKCSLTGVEEESDININSGNITLNSTFFSRSGNNSLITWSNLPTEGKVQVYSIIGAKVFEEEFSDRSLSWQLENENSISSGIYFYRISDSNGNILKKDKFTIVE